MYCADAPVADPRLAAVLRRAWQAVGIAGDVHFLVVSLGGVVLLGAIGTGLLSALTSIPVGFLIAASVGLLAVLLVTVPLLLRRVWPALAGPSLVIGDWRVALSLGTKGPTGTASVGIWNRRDAGGKKAEVRGAVPEVEVFDLAGHRVYHHVGWASGASRNFPATREEERLKLAEKEQRGDLMLVGHVPPLFATGDDVLEGKLSIRGENLSKPITARFTLGLRQDGSLWVEPADQG